MNELRKAINDNLPVGFSEEMRYEIGYVVLHLYPAGYHFKPSLPLLFINIISRRNHIALHHVGIYADKKLQD